MACPSWPRTSQPNYQLPSGSLPVTVLLTAPAPSSSSFYPCAPLEPWLYGFIGQFHTISFTMLLSSYFLYRLFHPGFVTYVCLCFKGLFAHVLSPWPHSFYLCFLVICGVRVLKLVWWLVIQLLELLAFIIFRALRKFFVGFWPEYRVAGIFEPSDC